MIELENEGRSSAYMELANWKFMLSNENHDDNTLKKKLMSGILEGNMAPYYCIVCADLGWDLDENLLLEMQEINKAKLLEYDKDDNVKSDDDDDDEPKMWKDKLEYLCSIGDNEASLKLATDKSQDTLLSVNNRLDAIFTIFRIGYFHGCNLKLMRSAIEKATQLIDGNTGVGDWSARNKLKAYEAICFLGHRDYSRAAYLFLDAIPTFESYELLDFRTLVHYTMLSSMVALSRCEMNTKLKKNDALIQALHANYLYVDGTMTDAVDVHYPDMKKYHEYLYDGQYKNFFKSLAKVEMSMKNDKLLHLHYKHYVREMRIKAYSQHLQAYRSLSLESMAKQFGVTEGYIEKEVSRFATLGRLQCKIDSVARTIIPSGFVSDSKCGVKLLESAPEAVYERGIMYQIIIKHGDILLNRVKKLTRVMDF